MKYALKVTGILFGILAGIVLVLILTLDYFFFSMYRLPEGEFITEAVSPDGHYTVRASVSYGNATVANAVRGELIDHKKNDKEKNIFWQYREQEAEISWTSDHTVTINGIELDVRKDVYDYRKK
ncbi:DUF5412 family protein [Sporosarcina limicola]|uniref:DUF5412 domain-containing protein n=1 Tax=Sporosarcina limicola TaxID=34101 RepID=A0A927ME39_9BACL|nr:DUF5412 family protein [Sporosarcina limicola]MBE1553069.1 hypothetical protein [Sporosarcina limicola]